MKGEVKADMTQRRKDKKSHEIEVKQGECKLLKYFKEQGTQMEVVT